MQEDLSGLQGTISKDMIDHLNSFRRGELSAVETYKQAIEKLQDSSDQAVLGVLRQNHDSHLRRVELLGEVLRQFGGEPSESSGAWGAFAKLIEGGAKLFGEKAALAALEEGEDHGVSDYKRDLEDLDPTVRRFVETTLLPEQLRTHDAMSRLKRLH